jgi:PAS domain S-box-containing protein
MSKIPGLLAHLPPESPRVDVSVAEWEAARVLQANLIASEMRYRRLFETARDGILLLNALSARIEDVNPYLVEMLGYPRDVLVGKTLWEIGAFTDREAAKRMFATIQTVGYVRYDNLPLKTSAGVEVQVEFVSNAYRVDGKTVIQCNVRDITIRKADDARIQVYIDKLRRSMLSLVDVACEIAAMRAPSTAAHERRVSDLAVRIAAEIGLDAERREGLRVAAYLHDLGTIVVPSEFLSKPGPLSEIEMKIVQEHARAGYNVLRHVEWPWPIAEVALQHHERIDGSGYPQGLMGAETLIESKIVAVADVVEAMCSLRPYRLSLGTAAALDEIERGRGTTYDTEIADTCLRLFRKDNYVLPP